MGVAVDQISNGMLRRRSRNDFDNSYMSAMKDRVNLRLRRHRPADEFLRQLKQLRAYRGILPGDSLLDWFEESGPRRLSQFRGGFATVGFYQSKAAESLVFWKCTPLPIFFRLVIITDGFHHSHAPVDCSPIFNGGASDVSAM